MTIDPASASIGTLRMLVIEEDPETRSLLRTAGRTEGFEVVEAARGGEAIEILSTHSFDAVVLDLVLPRVRGEDVLAYYHGRYPGRRNVVILSPAGMGQLMTIAPAEVFGVATKPLDLAIIRTMLRACARQQEAA